MEIATPFPLSCPVLINLPVLAHKAAYIFHWYSAYFLRFFSSHFGRKVEVDKAIREKGPNFSRGPVKKVYIKSDYVFGDDV